MRKILVLIVLFSVLPLSSYCQDVISGRVKDTSDKGLQHVNVILLSADSATVNGSETDADGNFSIPNTDGRGTMLRVTCLGYKPVMTNISGRKDISVVLSEKSEMLDEVVVNNSSTYRMEGNKLITSVSGTPLDKLFDINQVLEFVPGVMSTPNGVEVFGKGVATFYINGRKVRNEVDLKRLEMKNVKSIELIKNPGAEYSGSDRAVINIVTFRKPGEGFSAYNSNWFQQAHNFSAQEVLSMNYRKDKLDLFGYLNYMHNGNYQDLDTEYTIKSPKKPLDFKSNSKTYSPRNYVDASVGFDYYFNSTNSLGVNYSHTYRNVDGHLVQTTDVFSKGALDDKQQYASEYELPLNTDVIGAYYDGWINKKIKINANAQYYYGRDKNNTRVTEDSEVADDRIVTTSNRADNKIFASDLSVMYTWNKKHRLRIGSEYYYTDRKYTFYNKEGLLPNVSDKVDQDILAAYIGYTFRQDKFRLDAGLRYEHYRFDVYNNGVFSSEQSKIYNDVYPNISLSYPFGKLKTSLSYSMKTSKPSYHSLSSNMQYDSRNAYNTGNPLLQPAKIQDVQFMMQYGIATLTLGYVHTKDMIIRDYSLYDENVPILLKSYRNNPSLDEFNAHLTLQKKIGIWIPTFSVGVSVDNYDYYGEGKKFKDPLFRFSFDNILTLPHNWNIYMDAVFGIDGRQNMYKVRPDKRVSLYIVKSWKNVQLGVLFNDIFNTLEEVNKFDTDVCKYWVRNNGDYHNIQVTLRININNFNSKYRGRNVTGSESSRM